MWLLFCPPVTFGLQARKELKRLREAQANKKEQEEQVCTTYQSPYRDLLTSRDTDTLQERRMHVAAVLIQAYMRGRAVRHAIKLGHSVDQALIYWEPQPKASIQFPPQSSST
jgi:hypothetical protein